MKVAEEFLFYGIRLFLLLQCAWGVHAARRSRVVRALLIAIGLLLMISLLYSVLHALSWDGWISDYPALILQFGSEIPMRQLIEWLLGLER